MTSSLRIVRSLFASVCRPTSVFKGLIPAALIAVPLLATPGFAQTTISGTVFAPNAVDPLSHVLVYITTGTVAPFTAGAECPGPNCLTASTAVPANAIVSSYTAVDGTFTLSNVPGKHHLYAGHPGGQLAAAIYRGGGRQSTHGTVLDMPTTHTEGDIPLIAIATGSADAVECVLRDVGVADKSSPTTMALAEGASISTRGTTLRERKSMPRPPRNCAHGGNTTTLNGYDMVMFPCQGVSVAESAAYIDNLLAYTSSGGRAFVTHDSRVWINTADTVASGPFAGVDLFGGGESEPASSFASGWRRHDQHQLHRRVDARPMAVQGYARIFRLAAPWGRLRSDSPPRSERSDCADPKLADRNSDSAILCSLPSTRRSAQPRPGNMDGCCSTNITWKMCHANTGTDIS